MFQHRGNKETTGVSPWSLTKGGKQASSTNSDWSCLWKCPLAHQKEGNKETWQECRSLFCCYFAYFYRISVEWLPGSSERFLLGISITKQGSSLFYRLVLWLIQHGTECCIKRGKDLAELIKQGNNPRTSRYVTIQKMKLLSLTFSLPWLRL